VADSTIGTRLLNQKVPEPISSAPAPAALLATLLASAKLCNLHFDFAERRVKRFTFLARQVIGDLQQPPARIVVDTENGVQRNRSMQ
jgi:hypothetical protein